MSEVPAEAPGASFARFLEGFQRKHPEWFVGGSPYVPEARKSVSEPKRAGFVAPAAPVEEPARDGKAAASGVEEEWDGAEDTELPEM